MPHELVEGALRDVTVLAYRDAPFLVLVSLPDEPTVALLNVRRLPGCIEVMNSVEAFLHVESGSRLAGRTDKHPNLPAVHVLRELLLLGIGVVVMDEGDFAGRDTTSKEFIPNVLVHRTSPCLLFC